MKIFVSVLGLLVSSMAFASLDDVRLPPGFVIEEYADVPKARSLAFGDRGTLFVSTRKARSVYAVVENEDGSTRTIELLNRMSTPNGIAFFEGDLYVAEIDRVFRYRNIEDNLEADLEGELLDIDLPSIAAMAGATLALGRTASCTSVLVRPAISVTGLVTRRSSA